MLSFSRRRMLQLTSASVTLGALGSRRALALQAADEPTTLRAFNRTIDVNGKPARVLGLALADESWGLTGEKGGRFQVKLINELETETLIHWHGLTPPSEQDGVPSKCIRAARQDRCVLRASGRASRARNGHCARFPVTKSPRQSCAYHTPDQIGAGSIWSTSSAAVSGPWEALSGNLGSSPAISRREVA
jgi:hypothetical protein